MARPRKLERLVDLFLRVPRETRETLEAEAARRGVKTVEIGREIVIAWANHQNTPVA